jgi:hypothetical protein
MFVLRPVISVREIPPNTARIRSHLPSIRTLVSQQPHDEETRLLQYLQQGVFGCFYPDPKLAHDVLEPARRVNRQLPGEALGLTTSSAPGGDSISIDPNSVLTDGTWLWPGVLVYYLARYHLRLDPAFVDHARARNWSIRPSEVNLDDLCWDAFRLPPEMLSESTDGRPVAASSKNEQRWQGTASALWTIVA